MLAFARIEVWIEKSAAAENAAESKLMPRMLPGRIWAVQTLIGKVCSSSESALDASHGLISSFKV